MKSPFLKKCSILLGCLLLAVVACGKTSASSQSLSGGESESASSAIDEKAYEPKSLTVTLYDTANNEYGFTYNTKSEPIQPVLQIQEGREWTDTFEEYPVTVTEATTDINATTFYVSKTAVGLKTDTEYIYRVYDKGAEVGSERATLVTGNPQAESFRFAHVSDTQTAGGITVGQENGKYFGQTLARIVGNNDFIVHTGDMVDSAEYERFWTAMIHGNFGYYSAIPMMTVSGNHETTYYGQANATWNHFHHKIPQQASTERGYYYSFIYGNCKFILINTNSLLGGQGLKTSQYEWLVRELENNTCAWTVVGMHNPMYSVGFWGADPTKNATALLLQSQLQGVFARYGVDIVLQGHDHCVSRTYPLDGTGAPQRESVETVNGVEYTIDPNGVLYLMNGAGGSDARSPYAVDSALYKYGQGSKACSWAEFTITGLEMRVSVKYTDGASVKTYHEWGIKKTG